MATTTNYGWETPDDTDLVKDGALAQRTTANAVDSTLGTALNNKLHAGLVLVKTQTIGSAVSSVTVTNAFSTTYNNYKIVIAGGAASVSNSWINMQLGSTASGYKFNLVYATYGSATNLIATSSSATSFNFAATCDTNNINMNLEVNAPFLTNRTTFSGIYAHNSDAGLVTGVLNDTTSYTAFTLTPIAGTITGGTIAVYGYAKD